MYQSLDFSLAATSFHMVVEPGKSFPYINYQIVVPIKMYNMYEEQWFSPFYILCLTVLRDIQGVTCESWDLWKILEKSK